MAPIIRSETFATSDDCTIAYSKTGPSRAGGQRLALIHSLSLNRSIWDGVAARLADGLEILTYDCRGHGRSGRRAEPYSTDLFARDLAELFDHVGWESASVAGCSMGGCVAQEFAGCYPTRTNALGLVDTTAWYGEDAPKKWRERAATARSRGLAKMVEFQVNRWFSELFRETHPESVKATTDIFLANDLNCYASTCTMLGDADLRPHLPSLHIPVAVMCGEDDQATPVAMARQLHQSIQGSTLTIFARARHLTPIECSEQIAAELRTLIGRTHASSAASSLSQTQ